MSENPLIETSSRGFEKDFYEEHTTTSQRTVVSEALVCTIVVSLACRHTIMLSYKFS